MLSLPPKRQHWVAKHSVGICGVNTELIHWNRRLDNHCPPCGAAEYARHVWTCPHPEAATRWEEQIHQLRDWLTRQHTNHMVVTAICDALLAWKHGHPPLLCSSLRSCPIVSPLLMEAFSQQTKIGWHGMMEGKLGGYWAATQQA